MISIALPEQGHILPMSVDNIGFLLDRLGEDCHPLQFLRELTQNSIEAINRTGKPGEIVWDVDWIQHKQSGDYKLCVTDTGDGMTGGDMIKFINQLSSSFSEQSFSGNFGVGAKIAAATRNHSGVVYCSWKANEGAMIELYRDQVSGQYGLRQFQHRDGSWEHYLPQSRGSRPDLIKTHGTRVTLHGNSKDHNTMIPPEGANAPSRWISKYLNTRYYRFPEGVTIRAREGWEYPQSDQDRNILRTLTGQKAYLDQHAQDSGRLDLNGATARWWILKDEKAITNNSGHIESAGHVAALHDDELYEMSSARAGMTKLQQFGITFGYRFVVIYIEPHETADTQVTTNTARTALLMNNDNLPWSGWALEFRDNMPEELREFVEKQSAGSATTDHTKTIRERLKDLQDLYRASRYKQTHCGTASLDSNKIIHVGPCSDPGSGGGMGGTSVNTGDVGTPRTRDGEPGNVYSMFERRNGDPARRVKSDPYPETRWVTTKDGTREYGDIEDRAAKYHDDLNLLLINADFRVFTDMVDHLAKDFIDQPGVRSVIEEIVRTWFEQALVETIIGIHSLRFSKEWSRDQVESALSEEALTAAVMQRYHIVHNVNRQLTRFGGRKVRAAS